MITRYTTPGLDDESVGHLQSLVQANIDSRDLYRKAAGRLGAGSLKATFELVARERDELARSLQGVLWSNFQAASDSRSGSSPRHGVLDHLRSTFGDTPSELLRAAIQAEEHMQKQYAYVMEVVRGRAIRQLLQEQLESVLASSERIRTMNDVCRKL